jgi:hypothetical protein
MKCPCCGSLLPNSPKLTKCHACTSEIYFGGFNNDGDCEYYSTVEAALNAFDINSKANKLASEIQSGKIYQQQIDELNKKADSYFQKNTSVFTSEQRSFWVIVILSATLLCLVFFSS